MNDPTKWVEGAENWDTDKHYRQRQERGFSDADWINFDTYLAWVIYNGMKKFREDGSHLFPTYEELDCIMDGFGGGMPVMTMTKRSCPVLCNCLRTALSAFGTRLMYNIYMRPEYKAALINE